MEDPFAALGLLSTGPVTGVELSVATTIGVAVRPPSIIQVASVIDALADSEPPPAVFAAPASRFPS
jgi:hypothetical protein